MRRISYEIGSRLFWTLAHLVYVPLLAFSNSGAVSNIAESENILNPKMMIPIPQAQFQLCHTASLCYVHIGNRAMEVHWAALSLRFARETGLRKTISQATRRYLQAMATVPVPEAERPENASRLRATWLFSIEKDGDDFLIDEQFEHYWALLQARDRCLAPPTTQTEIDELVNRAQFLAEMLFESGNEQPLAWIAMMRGDINVSRNDFQSASDNFKLALEIHIRQNARLEVPFLLYKIGYLELAWWTYKRTNEGFLDWQQLVVAFQNFENSCIFFEDQGNLSQAARCQFFMGDIWSKQLEFAETGKENSVNRCLHYLSTAAALRDRIRLEISARPGPQSIRNKQLLRASDSEITDKAISVCFNQNRFDSAWDWIQMSKARTLSDMLGVGLVIPGYLREKIDASEAMLQLLEEETILVQKMEKMPGGRGLGLQQELANLRNRMREFSTLADLLALREGKSESLHDLNWLLPDTSTAEPIILVDWVYIDKKIYIVVVDNERKPQMEEVENYVDLHEWVADYVSTDDKQKLRLPEAYCPLRDLDHLVEPLSRLTKPGIILVLSPSGPLHSIPLHALQLPDQQIVIERNPIVYCSNLSILHQCCLRSTLVPSGAEFVAMGFYPDHEEEQKKVYAGNAKYANLLGGSSFSGDQVTEASFKAHAEGAAIIHFHGHVVQDDNGNIFDQALHLFSLEDSQSTSQVEPEPNTGSVAMESDMEYSPPGFTVRDIFSLNLQSPVVTLIACESAHQEIFPGDDPIGLVSAFLVSGASSVLGTLWSIRSTDGRLFSDAFYEDIHQQSLAKRMNDGMIDLALATQQAVLKVRENPDTRAPYHWAAFVLHGTWRVKAFNVGHD